MKVAIVKYNAGNTQSVIYALERLGITPILSADYETLASADRVILPGVGEASSAMKSLRGTGISDLLKDIEQPFLGICVGMQLMCQHSAENDTQGLGIFEDRVIQFKPNDPSLKVPHMGWNHLKDLKSPLFKNIASESFAYFAHSFYVPDSQRSIARAYYQDDFCAALQVNNFYGVQFHPEKSATLGHHLFQNFLEL